jgi:hypothetical protein
MTSGGVYTILNVCFVPKADVQSDPKLIKYRKSYEDDRPAEIFFIEPDNLIIKEKRPIVRLQL